MLKKFPFRLLISLLFFPNFVINVTVLVYLQSAQILITDKGLTAKRL